ncbi:Arv1 protein [Phascolomyces articulosus]|uniref:Protein ARV n=1 Tax=Phascolomyces articulosus TaxID=60185 RepID=A0AAD5JT68_9FUNG|nr:Arv1 protein [Phascolomyces articulosus]
MPTCVECGASVRDLYTQYSKDNIRLTSCEKCNRFADKYIEHDFVIIFIDMLLLKPQVYRHLLFNRITQSGNGIEPHVARFAILLILFEVYIKWFRLETYYTDYNSTFAPRPLYHQYLYILALCVFEFVAFHGFIRFAIQLLLPQSKNIRYNYVAMALVISSFGKMLLILMVIWDYKQLEYSWLVGLIVLASNTEALSVYLGISDLRVFIIMVIGILGKFMAQFAFTFVDGVSDHTIWISL